MTVQWVASSDGWSEDAWKRICWQVFRLTRERFTLCKVGEKHDYWHTDWPTFFSDNQHFVTCKNVNASIKFPLVRDEPLMRVDTPALVAPMYVSVFVSQYEMRIILPYEAFNASVVLPLADIQRFNAWLRVVSDLAGGLRWSISGQEYGPVHMGYAVANDGIFESMADGQGWAYWYSIAPPR